MRSWSSRSDTSVVDEPFYAHYLNETGYAHPGADEIISSYENDWRKVIDQLFVDEEDGKTIRYQKHMTQHMLEHIDLSWIRCVSNCFLIRDPRAHVDILCQGDSQSANGSDRTAAAGRDLQVYS